MRRTINGIVYDTGKATEIASWWNNLPSSDFHYVSETLYRTSKGTYFLHGEGGLITYYGENTGGGWKTGEKVQPMTEQEAFQWCEKRRMQSAIDDHFKHLVSEA